MSNSVSDVILEKLSFNKMSKETIKSKRAVLNSFRDYLQNENLFPKYFRFSVKNPLFTDGEVIDFDVAFDSGYFNVDYKLIPELNACLFGVDLNSFDSEKCFSPVSGLKLDFIMKSIRVSIDYYITSRDVLRFYSVDGLEEKEKFVTEWLKKFDYDVSYILEVYPNLVAFFQDFSFSIAKSSGIEKVPSQSAYREKLLDKVFKDLMNSVYNDITDLVVNNFYYLDDRKFLPLYLAVFGDCSGLRPSVESRFYNSVEDSILVAEANLLLLDSLSSVSKKLYSKKVAKDIGVYSKGSGLFGCNKIFTFYGWFTGGDNCSYSDDYEW